MIHSSLESESRKGILSAESAYKKQNEPGTRHEGKKLITSFETQHKGVDVDVIRSQSHGVCAGDGFYVGVSMRNMDSKSNISRGNNMDSWKLSRMECPGCGRMMIPRVISYYGAAANTVCPFCVKVIWRAPKDKVTAFVEKLLIFGFGLVLLLFLFSTFILSH